MNPYSCMGDFVVVIFRSMLVMMKKTILHSGFNYTIMSHGYFVALCVKHHNTHALPWDEWL